MSSNPTRGFLIKFFPHSLFGDVYFHVRFYYFLRIVYLFVLIFFVVLYCIFFVFFNITMKFQGALCPSLAVVVLSSSVEPQSLAVSVSFLNVRFDRATFPFSIA